MYVGAKGPAMWYWHTWTLCGQATRAAASVPAPSTRRVQPAGQTPGQEEARSGQSIVESIPAGAGDRLV
jgi:hypothetical protein